MHLFLLIDDYLPSVKSAPLMFHQLANEFVQQGHRVTLATPSATLQGKHYSIEENGQLKIFRFRAGALKNIGFVKRAIHETLLSYNLLTAIRAASDLGRPDLIISYSPTIFFGTALHILKHRYHCPVYIILRDIFPQWCVDQGILSKYSPVYWYFKFFERLSYAAANAIGVEANGNLSYFSSQYRTQKRVHLLRNWFDCSSALETGEGLREKLHLQGKVIFFFGGNIGHAQDMRNIVALAEKLKTTAPEAHILLVGKGDEFDLVAQLCKEKSLQNITLLPAVPAKEYFQMLSQIDIGLFSLHYNLQTSNIPGKLLGYMAYAKPILGSVNPGNDLLTLIPEYRAGLVSVNPDVETFAQDAMKLCTDEKFRKKCGDASRLLLEKEFSVPQIAKRIIDCVNHLNKKIDHF